MQNTKYLKSGLIILCVTIFSFLNPTQIQAQAGADSNITQHNEFLRGQNPEPPKTFKAIGSNQVQIGGNYEVLQLIEQEWPAIALTDSESWIEVTFDAPTTTFGVQFWGDSNDGLARIIVDGTEVGLVDTRGGTVNFEKYIQISYLPNTSHKLRIEPVGQAGCGCNNTHVTVRAFGWGTIPEGASIVEEAPVIETFPIAEVVPADEAISTAEEIPMDDPQPVVEESLTVEEAPMSEALFADEEESFTAEETPQDDQFPMDEDPLAIEEFPLGEELFAAEEMFFDEELPFIGESLEQSLFDTMSEPEDETNRIFIPIVQKVASEESPMGEELFADKGKISPAEEVFVDEQQPVVDDSLDQNLFETVNEPEGETQQVLIPSAQQ